MSATEDIGAHEYEGGNGHDGRGASSTSLELEHVIAFNGSLSPSLLVHPDGERVVYASGASVVLGKIDDPHGQIFHEGHYGDITTLDLSPSGEVCDITIRDIEGEKPMITIFQHDSAVLCGSFSHDERLFASLGADGKLVISEMERGHIVASVPAQPQGAHIILWGGHTKDIKRRPTSNYLLVTAGDREMRVWDLNPRNGQINSIRCNAGHFVRQYSCIAFSKDTEYFFAGSTSGDVSVFQVKNAILHANIPVCTGGVTAIALDRDGSSVLVGGGDGSLSVLRGHDRQWETEAWATAPGPVTAIGAAADGGFYVGTRLGNAVRVGPPQGPGRALASVSVLFQSHSDAVEHVSYVDGENDRIITCSRDGRVRLWSLSDYSVVAETAATAQGFPTSAGYALQCIMAGWTDGSIRCFDATSGTEYWRIHDAHRGSVTAVAVSHNKKYIVSGGEEGEVRVWDLKSRVLVSHLKEHTLPVTKIIIFPDDQYAVTSGRDRRILCWDLVHEKRVANLIQRTGAVNDIALSKSGDEVVSVGQERRLSWWSLRSAAAVRTIANAHDGGEALAVAISSSGKYIATGGNDERIILWDYQTGARLDSRFAPSRSTLALQFSPDERQLVSVGDNGAVLVWNLYSDA